MSKHTNDENSELDEARLRQTEEMPKTEPADGIGYGGSEALADTGEDGSTDAKSALSESFFTRHKKALIAGAVCVAVACVAGLGVAYAAYTPSAMPLEDDSYATEIQEIDGVDAEKEISVAVTVTAQLPGIEDALAKEGNEMLVAPSVKFSYALGEHELRSDTPVDTPDDIWATGIDESRTVDVTDGAWAVAYYAGVLSDGTVYAAPADAVTLATSEDGPDTATFIEDEYALDPAYTMIPYDQLTPEQASAVISNIEAAKDALLENGTPQESIDKALELMTAVKDKQTEATDADANSDSASSDTSASTSTGSSDSGSSGSGSSNSGSSSSGSSSSGSSNSGSNSSSSGSSSNSSSSGKTKVWVDTTYKQVPVYQDVPIVEYTSAYMCNTCGTTYDTYDKAADCLVYTYSNLSPNHSVCGLDGVTTMTAPTTVGYEKQLLTYDTVVDVEGHWEYR